MSPAEIVLTIKNFLRWNEEKFESLHKDAPKIANPMGWRRPNEFWIRPDAWRSIFDNIAEMAVDAARALRDMDLLRIQDNVTCQAVVQVREKSTRAYVVKRQILEWKSGESYKSYNPATNKLAPAQRRA